MQKYIDNAVEQFRTLLNEQLKRVEIMEAGASTKDYSKAEKIVIGIIGGDGIGPIIVKEAKRLIEFYSIARLKTAELSLMLLMV